MLVRLNTQILMHLYKQFGEIDEINGDGLKNNFGRRFSWGSYSFINGKWL